MSQADSAYLDVKMKYFDDYINLENFQNDESINQSMNQTNPTFWLTIIEGYVIFFFIFLVIPN